MGRWLLPRKRGSRKVGTNNVLILLKMWSQRISLITQSFMNQNRSFLEFNQNLYHIIFPGIRVITTTLGKIFGKKFYKIKQSWTKLENFGICFSLGIDHCCEKQISAREIGEKLSCVRGHLNFPSFSFFRKALSRNCSATCQTTPIQSYHTRCQVPFYLQSIKLPQK